MTPILFLLIMAGVTLLAYAIQGALVGARRRALRRLAGQWHMRYVPHDLFNLAKRLRPAFPMPGVTGLLATDLIYGSEGDQHRYVFTAEYTLGAADRHRRDYRVVTFCEPREGLRPSGPPSLLLAPADLSLVEQYQFLYREAQAGCPNEAGRQPRTTGAADPASDDGSDLSPTNRSA